ncbi:hypothetical protein MKW98_029694 [Papaver atlanticum]|uniref:Cytochrome P450 n=1 Tax=Papaver atlanticum TaxID=357466 RepID=A0AAD4T6V1_9MAGN|nr:hypothetical protein MKW98_029694 [Papaver atlanticum]
MDDLSKSFVPATFILILICFLSIGLFLKKTSQAIDYWLFLGSLPTLARNSNRLPEWFTEVFCSLGRGSFFLDGPIFSNLKYFVTCHHKNIEYILKSHSNNFPKGPDFKQVFDPLGDGIFNVDSDAWKVQRRMAHAAFISSEYKDLVSNMCRRVVEDQVVPLLVRLAKTGTTIDLQEVCSRFAFDVNMNTIFGTHANYLSIELPSNDLAEAIDAAQEGVFYRHTMPMFMWKLKCASGKDTIASGLIWFFWLVSKTPSVEKKIIEELKVLISSKTEKLFEYGEWPWVLYSDDINGLVYLLALCESMRIYPPVSYSRKTVLSEAVLLDGSLVKPGMEIIIPFYSVGRMPWIWGEDCLEFRPERWMDDDGKLNRHENALVAAVLFNFQIEVLEGQHVRPKPAISLHTEKGLEVKIKKRVI